MRPKGPDTSAAWKAEAERCQAELASIKKDHELLLQDIAAARDALAHQIAQGGGQCLLKLNILELVVMILCTVPERQKTDPDKACMRNHPAPTSRVSATVP